MIGNNILKSVLRWLAVSNVIVSLAAGFLCYSFASVNQLPGAYKYGVLLFLLTFSVYNLQRIFDERGFHPEDLEFWKGTKRGLLYTSIITSILALIVGVDVIHFSWNVITFGLAFSFICLWYTSPFFGVKLREIPGLKIIIIALTWVATILVFPLLNEGVIFKDFAVEIIVLSLFITATILPFDIRDVHTDYLTQSTIPQLIGVKKTKLLGTFMFVLTAFIAISMGFISVSNGIFYFSILLEVILILKADSSRSILYFGLIDFGILLFALSVIYN